MWCAAVFPPIFRCRALTGSMGAPLSISLGCQADATMGCIEEPHACVCLEIVKELHGTGESVTYNSVQFDSGEPVQFDSGEPVAASAFSVMDALSYMPDRFDQSDTLDSSRSHTRYESAHRYCRKDFFQRTPWMSAAWKTWLRATIAGRAVTLLSPCPVEFNKSGCKPNLDSKEVPAKICIDESLRKLTITPDCSDAAITIFFLSMLVVCPAMSFLLFLDDDESGIASVNLDMAVIIQYADWNAHEETSQRTSICFLENSAVSRDVSVHILTDILMRSKEMQQRSGSV